MTYVVTEPCVNCRYTDCALVCPVEAFHLDDDMLHINPETCIDCDACVPECPVEAVFAEANVPPEWAHFTQMNAEKALSGLPTITARLDPLCESVSPTHSLSNEKEHQALDRRSGFGCWSGWRCWYLHDEEEPNGEKTTSKERESGKCLGATGDDGSPCGRV